jgi:hypothetical protein
MALICLVQCSLIASEFKDTVTVNFDQFDQVLDVDYFTKNQECSFFPKSSPPQEATFKTKVHIGFGIDQSERYLIPSILF